MTTKMDNYRCIGNYEIVRGKFNEVPNTTARSNARIHKASWNLGQGKSGERNVEFGARQRILENSFNKETGAEKEELSGRWGREREKGGRDRKGREERGKKMEFAHDRRIPDEYQ